MHYQCHHSAAAFFEKHFDQIVWLLLGVERQIEKKKLLLYSFDTHILYVDDDDHFLFLFCSFKNFVFFFGSEGYFSDFYKEIKIII
jgi:hypothetical protein